MKKTIYHGSIQRLEHPFYLGGKAHNDYGKGFYCTEEKDMAAEWAVSGNCNGWINEYEIDISDLTILNLNASDYCILHWLAVLLENRTFDLSYALAQEAKEYILKNFSVAYTDADIIIGYRADDSYFAFAQDFLSGAISYRQLSQAMHLGKLGNQFVLKSPIAFERLRFLGAEEALGERWYPLRTQRDSEARNEYFASRTQRRRPGDLYIIQILDEGMTANDPRLR